MVTIKTNPQKLKAIHTAFGRHGITDKDEKADIIIHITGGRTPSTRELTDSEANALLSQLNKQGGTADRKKKMKNKILRLGHEMNWKIPGTTKIDMDRINRWCVEDSYLKKPLDKYTYEELPKLVTQFEIVHKKFINKL